MAEAEHQRQDAVKNVMGGDDQGGLAQPAVTAVVNATSELIYNMTKEEWDLLEPREKHIRKVQFRQAEYRAKHAGHEKMHAEMAYLILLTLIAGQFLLFYWKKRHPKSYDMATLVGMIAVPFFMAVHFDLRTFFYVWFLYMACTSVVMYYSSLKPLPQSVSRWVYKWFYFVWKISYAVGTFGYLMVALNPMFRMIGLGINLFGYGLYFGTVTRDMAELVATRMASAIGYVSKDGIPMRSFDPNVCSICGEDLLDHPGSVNKENVIEPSHQLNCGHVFHDFCIRGWCLIGKKDMCPYCKEKVDLKKQFASPWALQDVYFGNFLDLARYFIVWQPIIIIITEMEISLFHLE